MARYCSNYYVFKASIKEQSNTIENAFEIWVLNNLGLVFKTYITIVNKKMQKDNNWKK